MTLKEIERQSARNFRLFCDTHFVFGFRDWGADQLAAAASIQEAVLRRETRTVYLERGRGKTTLAKAAVLWAERYQYSEFAVLIGPTQAAARDLLEACCQEMNHNTLLKAPFGQPMRAGMQVKAVGINGCLRGLTHQRADGSFIRPSLVIVDDHHTAHSLRAPGEYDRRERTLTRDVLALGGVGQPLTAIIFRTGARALR